MANVIEGQFTIKQVLRFTDQSEFKNRFDYRDRDVLKYVQIRKIKKFIPDRINAPEYKYEVRTFSYPQYKPYFIGKDKRNRKIRYQRSIKHEYNIVLELPKLSINVPFKWRVGSEKKPNLRPPQKYIKSIYRSNGSRWSKERKAKHRKYAQYLDVGDYNSRKLGVNLDFYFRLEYVLAENKMLFGRNWASSIPLKTNPKKITFFDKHTLRLIIFLMQKGILKDDYPSVF